MCSRTTSRATRPLGEVNGRDELVAQVSDWRDGLTGTELVVDGIAVDGSTRHGEVAAHRDHTGVVLVNEDVLFEPTGSRVTLASPPSSTSEVTASAGSGTTTTSTTCCASCGLDPDG